MPAILPEPPEEEIQSEKDTENWMSWVSGKTVNEDSLAHTLRGWRAALAYERREVLKLIPGSCDHSDVFDKMWRKLKERCTP